MGEKEGRWRAERDLAMLNRVKKYKGQRKKFTPPIASKKDEETQNELPKRRMVKANNKFDRFIQNRR